MRVDAAIELVRCRRKRLVFLLGARDTGVEYRALSDVGHAARVGVDGEGKELGQPFGMMDGDVETEDRAVAPADDRSLGSFRKSIKPRTSEAIRS